MSPLEWKLSVYDSAVLSRVMKFLLRRENGHILDRFVQYLFDWHTAEERQIVVETLRYVLDKLEAVSVQRS